MGIIQSVFCSITFCVERVMTWTCCAFVLILLMFSIIILMIYGISVGYHYAQKELASFAMSSKSNDAPADALRSGPGIGPDLRPVVRLVAINKTVAEQQRPQLEVYRTKKPGTVMYIETSLTPLVVLETERPPKEPEMSAHDKELAYRLIGRIRRSQNMTSTTTGTTSGTTTIPFLRPLKEGLLSTKLLIT